MAETGRPDVPASTKRARRRLAAALAALVLLPIWFLVTAVPAEASCTRPPVASAHRFTGVVVTTTDQGRTATVRTDDGLTVTVVGRGEPSGAITSVDRVYTTGARYEFHPLNAASPYVDNACTATRQLSQPAGPGGATGSSGTAPASNGRLVGGLIAAAVFAGLVAVAAVVIRRRGLRRGSTVVDDG